MAMGIPEVPIRSERGISKRKAQKKIQELARAAKDGKLKEKGKS